MIIAAEKSAPIVTSALAAPSTFRIKASARAFKILSGFYSDPLLAIPRELGANAWDSHVKAGNTNTMFEVHAPNTLEPWFSIRDFGTGLSRQDVEQIYTTYFESTKTHENDSDGCMGLGSKTPFNYTENFSVTSWFNGEKYIYNCFIDQNGVPSILHFATEKSKESNGLEVKCAIKANDINMFVDKIRHAYAPFRFRPVIKGATITYPEIKYLFKGNGWALRSKDDAYSHDDSRAYMGNYSYPINVGALYSGNSSHYNDKNYEKVTTLLNRGAVELYFDIGDLEVAPNKEALQYDADQKTQKAIIKAALKCFDELYAQIQKQIEKPNTLWEAMNLFRKYSAYDSPFRYLTQIIGEIPIHFDGKKIDTADLHLTTVNDACGLKTSNDNENWSQKYGPFSLEIFSYKTRTGQLRTTRENSYSARGNEALFFVTRSESLKRSRIRHYLLTHYPNGNFPTIHIIHDPMGKVWKAHKKYFGLPDTIVFDIESLPKPPPKPRSPSTATTDEIHVYKVDSDHWTTDQLVADSKSTYYYVNYLYTSPVFKGLDVDRSTVTAAIHYGISKKLFGGSTRFYGINRKNRRMLRTGKWINFMDLVEKHITKDSDDLAHELYLQDVYYPSLSDYQNLRHRVTRSDFIKHLENKDSKKVFETFTAAFEHKSSDQNYVVLARYFKIKAKKKSTFDSSLADQAKLINEKYMNLFNMVDAYSSDGKSLARIINFIDKNS